MTKDDVYAASLAAFKSLPGMKHWSANKSGPVPTGEHFTTVLAFARGRLGRQLLYVAMTLRPGGCTADQYLATNNGETANNRRTTFAKRGLIKCSAGGSPMAWSSVPTARGANMVDRYVAAQLDAPQAAPKAPKARKAKVTKARKPRAVKAPAPAPVAAEPPQVTADAPQVSADKPEFQA